MIAVLTSPAAHTELSSHSTHPTLPTSWVDIKLSQLLTEASLCIASQHFLGEQITQFD